MSASTASMTPMKGRAPAKMVSSPIRLSFSVAYPARQAIDGLLELRALLPDSIAIWAGGAAVRDKHKRLPGIRVVGGLDDTLAALRDWRAEHP